ncbi:hypothetical protein HO173_005232 [Letharia columbiana]|uniref:Uncharacterized protein n=1 Tax=Letharia columbiana TaxID=112416 RepID=A0A8H6FX97_9LECA|nr:uncharacterized protein HO173_005232 [Letharia columbiana]KAF6236451.1 hypothetical protein HO173_005232 [Letharia columbiana]
MLPSLIAVIFLLAPLFASPSSLPPSLLPLLPSNSTLSSANLTARMNQVNCRRDPESRPLSDFSTCIPSLFRLYATPRIHRPVVWDPGDFKQWGPETDLGGCYILVDGGGGRDVFSIQTLLGPAVWALGKCFVGEVESRYLLAKTRVGPRKDWFVSIVLEVSGVAVGNGSVS